MNRKELTMMISKRKNPLGYMVYTKIYQRCKVNEFAEQTTQSIYYFRDILFSRLVCGVEYIDLLTSSQRWNVVTYPGVSLSDYILFQYE